MANWWEDNNEWWVGKLKNERSLVTSQQFTVEKFQQIFSQTTTLKRYHNDGWKFGQLTGQNVALLFYEPSTRTRVSFDAAVKYLGGSTLVIENPQSFSSVAKGETFEDTIRTIGHYSNLIVLRTQTVGQALQAARISDVPIINAGDGNGEHPTQALLDMYTIQEKVGNLEGIRGLVVGDLFNSRTVHSLLNGLATFSQRSTKRTTIYFLAPPSLELATIKMTEYAKKYGLDCIRIKKLEEVPKDLHFWYWTRVQKERFENNLELYLSVKDTYILTPEMFNQYAGADTILMHPLPRNNELSKGLDCDPRSVYLTKQMENGLFVRMALLLDLDGSFV